jgi:ankyrin repeat protein
MQLPPQWESWLDAARILVDNDASVHEIVHGQMVGSVNILHPQKPDKTLEYLNLLKETGYMEFGMVDGRGFSALRSAIRSPSHALNAIRVLQQLNVDLQKILDDGRSFLHIAAELAPGVEVLEYVYSNGCEQYTNRQDNYGWTPLHWCVSSTSPHAGSGMDPLAKFKFLLSKGADLAIKAKESPLMPWGFYDYQRFTPLDLAEANEPDLFRDILLEARNQPSLNDNDDLGIFYDAVETLEPDIV